MGSPSLDYWKYPLDSIPCNPSPSWLSLPLCYWILLNGCSVAGLLVNIHILDSFSYPQHLREKQTSLAHGPSRDYPLLVLGGRTPSSWLWLLPHLILPPWSYLFLSTKDVTNHWWKFCFQSKTPPNKFIHYIIQPLQGRSGVTVRRSDLSWCWRIICLRYTSQDIAHQTRLPKMYVLSLNDAYFTERSFLHPCGGPPRHFY